MRLAILTPTYKDHFKYIPKMLRSYEEYIEDFCSFNVYFVINKNEKQSFEQLIKPYLVKYSNIKILIFDELLKRNNIKETPSELLKKYGKFSYQSLKKLYAIIDTPEDCYFLVDSESMCVSPTNLQTLFENYNANPFLVYSDIKKRQKSNDFFKKLVDTHSYLLHTDQKLWYLEVFSWFFYKDIIKDIVDEFGTPIEIVDHLFKESKNKPNLDKHLFEGILYYGYIYKNNYKYNFKIIDIDGELENNLPEDIHKIYLQHFYQYMKGNGGVIEYFMTLLDEQNLPFFIKLCKKNKLNIFRCEYTDYKNYKLQYKFMQAVKPNFYVVSQKHYFGLNNTLVHIFKTNKKILNIAYHLNRFVRPQKLSFKWIFEPILVLWHTLCFFLSIPQLMSVYFKLKGFNN